MGCESGSVERMALVLNIKNVMLFSLPIISDRIHQMHTTTTTHISETKGAYFIKGKVSTSLNSRTCSPGGMAYQVFDNDVTGYRQEQDEGKETAPPAFLLLSPYLLQPSVLPRAPLLVRHKESIIAFIHGAIHPPPQGKLIRVLPTILTTTTTSTTPTTTPTYTAVLIPLQHLQRVPIPITITTTQMPPPQVPAAPIRRRHHQPHR